MPNRTFRSLHQGASLLVLPNAWDAGSARLIESVGVSAIATTSAGVAWSRGYPDGDALPIEQLLATVREIARVIRVPLTIDIEGGYSDDPAHVSLVVAGVIDAGAVGINIEDVPGRPTSCAQRSRRQGKPPRAPASICSSMPAPTCTCAPTVALRSEVVLRRARRAVCPRAPSDPRRRLS